MKLIFGSALVFILFGFVGTVDYIDALNRESAEKVARPKRAAQVQARESAGPRPQRCAGNFIAKQADGGKWVFICLDRPRRV